MSSTHDIRLAGPWEFVGDDNGPSQRCSLPFSLPDAGGAAVNATLTRRFHRPGGLGQTSAVQIVVTVEGDLSMVNVNNAVVDVLERDAGCGDNVFTVTGRLRDFNTLQITLSADGCREVRQVVLRIIEG